MKVYLIGPYSKDGSHRQRFAEVQARAEAAGHEVLSPVAWDDLEPVYDRKDYIPRDVALILAADAVVAMEGWQLADGCRAEILVAAWAKKSILNDIEFVPAEYIKIETTYVP